jgi:hypothetical protein
MPENSFGNRIVNPNRDMAIYDRLPIELRQVLRNAIFDFSAGDMRIYMLRHGMEFAIKRLLKVEQDTLNAIH